MQKLNNEIELRISEYKLSFIFNNKLKFLFSSIKLLILFIIIILLLRNLFLFPKYYISLNKAFINIQKNLNKIKYKIKIAIYTTYIGNGGRARITVLLLNYLYKIKMFDLYLFTFEKQKSEYIIPNDTKRIIIRHNLLDIINENKIDILIYQLTNVTEIDKLNNLKNLKVIFYHHSSVLGWIYFSFYYFKLIYKTFKNSKYVITLVPYENDYLFKKWGIRSILMNNFMTYEYNSVVPSNLSSKTILMIGRGNDKNKRFDIGIKAMKYIIKEIPECELKIISTLNGIKQLKYLVNILNLKRNVKFVGYIPNPKKYFKNASLHFFPTICESFGLVLSETKIYGIPSILLGLDYVSLSKGGTIIIYDDKPETLAKEAVKVLKNDKYRKKLGREARNSIKSFNNKILLLKWIKLILSVYKGDYYYDMLRNQDKKLPQSVASNILKNQIKLLKMRLPKFKNITIKEFENFTFLQNLK